jgi:hypothetical protein
VTGRAKLGRDPLEQALGLLERATDARARLRALEAVRAGLALELKDHARSRSALKRPTDEQPAQLQANVLSAWAEFEKVQDGGLETALRALQGVREAVGQLRAATTKLAADEPVVVAFNGGKPRVWPGVTRPEFMDFYGVPGKFRSADFGVKVQLNFGGPPGVVVSNRLTGKTVWRVVPTVPFRVQLPGSNGNGKGAP